MSLATVAENKRGILRDMAAREAVVGHLPCYYAVHLAMPCNQACIMCVPDGMHARDVLGFEEFVELFDQVKDHADHITLIGGETFMYPRFPDVLELLSRHPVEVTINTNSVMLDDRVIPGLLSLNALNLKCSIDAATRETYRRIRGRDHFDRVTANMRRFAELARDRPETRVITVYVVMRENLDEVLPFIDFAKTLSPHRVEFHPVRHVEDWQVQNGTGWDFDGREQACQFFADEYNDVMRQAAAKCEREGVEHEVILV
jgi:MoaA/NifB/PqqE/SkfB family radical SAM enzyme